MKRIDADTDAYPHMTEERLTGIRRDAENGKCAAAQTLRLCDLVEALWDLGDRRLEQVAAYRAQELAARYHASVSTETQISSYVPIQSAIEMLRNCPIHEILAIAAKYPEPECAQSILDAAAYWLQTHGPSITPRQAQESSEKGAIGWGRGMFIAGAASGVTPDSKSTFWRDHRCTVCKNARKSCPQGGYYQCSNPIAKND